MTRQLFLFIYIVVFVFMGMPAVFAADWPWYMGPESDGVSAEDNLISIFPAEGPAESWTVAVGVGYGGPAVRDGEVYLLDREEEARDVLRCLDLDTGKEKWRYSYDAPGSTGHSGSRTTPTVDEKQVYSVGLLGDLLCVDRSSQEVVWQRNLLKEYDVALPDWGVSQAPFLYEDRIIVAPQSPKAFVAAYDKNTGEVIWETPGEGGLGYSSPRVVSLCGQDQVVMISASENKDKGRVEGFSVEDGSLLWSWAGWQCQIPIPWVTPLPDNRLFITGGYKAGSVMIQLEKEGDKYAVKELWRLDMNSCGSQIHPPLVYRDHLYVASNSNEKELGLMCVDYDGKVLWKTRDDRSQPRFERGGFILAGKMMIALDGKKGSLHLVDPLPFGYKERSQAQVLDGNRMWAPLALSDGRLLLRTQDIMKCLDLRPASE
ncbi:MAG: PQQ-binding-like beta-propeller repeat protein [Candidatus Hydrogenedens sp.]|jgi:outer membrane protein assembly factor BamB|nr:PQQ-binding-like beta-propeller repeat protein [Candidatus Hydrogenedens sp.]